MMIIKKIVNWEEIYFYIPMKILEIKNKIIKCSILLAILIIFYDYGFDKSLIIQQIIVFFYQSFILVGIASMIIRVLFENEKQDSISYITDLFICFFLITIFLESVKIIELSLYPFIRKSILIYISVIIIIIRELAEQKFKISSSSINPAKLFVISFIILIFIGTIALILPNSTIEGISFIDALFTATSAVCVTGLVVVDTNSAFTQYGQIVILMLIQTGGIGIMTFASYFSFFFKGKSSFENQLLLKDISNLEKLSEVFSILKVIVSVTIFIEIIGSILIYYSLDSNYFTSVSNKVFFAIFHSISSFCNAGFSTMTDGLYDDIFKFNYSLHIIISSLFIVGGLGFPITLNLFRYIYKKITNSLLNLIRSKKKFNYPRLINVNTKIVLFTTLILLCFGSILFFIFEYNNTLKEHSLYGKIITSFFSAATPRTAGFNTIDYSLINIQTSIIIILLMWIGASPSSTGGGIKTSTVAIAYLGIVSIIRRNSRLEIFKREIKQETILRSLAIIFLSIIVILVSFLLIITFEPEKEILGVFFETVSAFSTVGLSMGITSELTIPSKIVIIFTMFIGRVSMLTILISFFKKNSNPNYKYPSENILIN